MNSYTEKMKEKERLMKLEDDRIAEFATRTSIERLSEILELMEDEVENECTFELMKECRGKPITEWPFRFLQLRALEYENKRKEK